MFAEELVKIYSFHTFDGIGGAMSGKKNPMVKKAKYLKNFHSVNTRPAELMDTPVICFIF